jgi:hypothetical protein
MPVERNVRQGIYRIRGIGGRPNDVRVDDEGITVPVEESLYCARGYWPHIDELPWEDAYRIQQTLAAARAAARR